MNVLFDVGVLGMADIVPRARTGIYRWVDSMLGAVISQGGCDIHCCGFRHPGLAEDWAQARRLPAAPAGMLGGALDRYAARSAAGGARGMVRVMAGLARSAGRLLPVGVPTWVGGMDVFHSPHYAHLPRRFPSGFPARKFLTMYDVIPLLRPDLFAWNESNAMRSLVGRVPDDITVVAISNSTADGVAEFLRVPRDRIHVVYPGVDRSLFHPVDDKNRQIACRSALGIPERPYFLCLNTIEPRKNLKMALGAYLHAVRSGALRDEMLVLAGPPGWGWDAEFEGLVKEGCGRIVRTGFVPDEFLAPLYSGARAFLYPSLLEGFGLPALEAMSCGTPVLCSNTSSLPEVVADSGVLLPPDSLDAWVGALESLTDADLASLANRSLDRAGEFGWERSARMLVEVWKTDRR